MKRLLLLLTLSALSLAASAQTLIGLHLASVHDKPGFNGVNPGLYINRDGMTAGIYYNSERRTSVYGGYTFAGDLPMGSTWGVTVGAITGYPGSALQPLVVPSLTIPDKLFGGAWRISYAARIKKDGAQALHLSHEWAL